MADSTSLFRMKSEKKEKEEWIRPRTIFLICSLWNLVCRLKTVLEGGQWEIDLNNSRRWMLIL